MFHVSVKSICVLVCVLAVAAGLTRTVRADVSDKRTIVTFGGTVEIPGKVLPAGTYVFKILDSTAERNIVQIFDKDEQQLYATILAIPDYRDNPTGNTVIRFEERASGSPEAIKEWFYPGDDYGVQFVYPHQQAMRVAKRTNLPVLSMRDEMQQHIAAPAKSASAQSVQAMQKTEVSAVNPSGQQGDMSQAVKPKK